LYAIAGYGREEKHGPKANSKKGGSKAKQGFC
jgi:hypothetical protein